MPRYGSIFAAGLLALSVGAFAKEKKPVKKDGVDCGSAKSIRMFKDAVWNLGHRSQEADWARRLCGKKAADAAGVEAVRPPEPEMAEAMPAYDMKDPEGSRIELAKWFKAHLPVSVAQAAKLALSLIPEEPEEAAATQKR